MLLVWVLPANKSSLQPKINRILKRKIEENTVPVMEIDENNRKIFKSCANITPKSPASTPPKRQFEFLDSDAKYTDNKVDKSNRNSIENNAGHTPARILRKDVNLIVNERSNAGQGMNTSRMSDSLGKQLQHGNQVAQAEHVSSLEHDESLKLQVTDKHHQETVTSSDMDIDNPKDDTRSVVPG